MSDAYESNIAAFVDAVRRVHRPSYAEMTWDVLDGGALGKCSAEVRIIRGGTAAHIEWTSPTDLGVCYSTEVDSPEALAEQLRAIVASVEGWA